MNDSCRAGDEAYPVRHCTDSYSGAIPPEQVSALADYCAATCGNADDDALETHVRGLLCPCVHTSDRIVAAVTAEVRRQRGKRACPPG